MDIATYLIDGISRGMTYALIAMGFVVIFRGTKVLNFAQGSMLVMGAYLITALHSRLGFVGAVLASLLVTGFVGVLINRLLMRPVRHAHADVAAMIAIGVNIVLGAELTRRIGAQVLTAGDPWKATTYVVLGIRLPETRLIALGVSIVLLVGFLLLNKYSMLGLASRAASEDPEMASLVGASLRKVGDFAWVFGGALAAIAGLFLIIYPRPGLVVDTSSIAIVAFPAVIIGGLESIGGAVLGGLVVGIAQSLTLAYQSHLAFLGQGIDGVVPWVLMITVLLWKPTGLLGRKPAYRI